MSEDKIWGPDVTVGDVGGMNQGASTIQSPMPAHRTRESGRTSAGPTCIFQTEICVCNMRLNKHHENKPYLLILGASPTTRDRRVFFDPCSITKWVFAPMANARAFFGLKLSED